MRKQTKEEERKESDRMEGEGKKRVQRTSVCIEKIQAENRRKENTEEERRRRGEEKKTINPLPRQRKKIKGSRKGEGHR